MLTLHCTRRQLRQTACGTQFAWMFALLSGVANACLIEQGAPDELGSILLPVGMVAGDTAGRATRQVKHVNHHAEGEGDGPGNDSAKAGCLKFCADESSAVTKGTAILGDVLAPILVARVQRPPAAPVAAAAQWRPVERPASVGPPLFIRLLRLTI